MGIVGQDGGEGEEAGAGGDGGHAGRGEAQGQWGDRQGQALELGQVLHLQLLLERVEELEISFSFRALNAASLFLMKTLDANNLLKGVRLWAHPYDGVHLRRRHLLGSVDGAHDLLLMLQTQTTCDPTQARANTGNAKRDVRTHLPLVTGRAAPECRSRSVS